VSSVVNDGSPGEDAKLKDAVEKHEKDWVSVAAMVPDRTNKQCREYWAQAFDPAIWKNTGKWKPEEDAKLIEAVQKHDKDWVSVAAMVPDRTNRQCRQRWTQALDPAIGKKAGQSKPEEDAKLTEAVQKHGKKWVAVAKLVPGRTNIQCRQRWIFTLDPTNGNKGRWTPEEDAKLTEAIQKHGKKWVAVAKLVPGRTNQHCRKRWARHLDPDRASNTAEEEHNAGNDEVFDSVPV
jgi:myb proto-oncogene protein